MTPYNFLSAQCKTCIISHFKLYVCLIYLINDWGNTMAPYNMRSTYRKTSSISQAKPQNLNVSRLVLQSSLPNPLKPGVKPKMMI